MGASATPSGSGSHPSGFDPSRIASELTRGERQALQWFSESGFVCSFRPEWAGLSERSYTRLTKLGLFESHWTWASTTRPDTGLSDKGRAVRAALEAIQ
jgi:hypothetical protein